MYLTESKYRTLLEALKKDILGGKYNSGSSFPSIRALVRKFGVSKNTVQHAIDELVHQGLITRIQGRGTFVTRQGSSRKLGLIVPDIAQAEFFSLIVREISRLAQKEGYTLLFCEISSPDADCRAMIAEKSAREFVEQGVAGVICQPIEFLKDSEQITRRILSVFDEASVPVVLCDYDFTGFPKRSAYDVVGIDNVKAGALLYEHVRSAGAKRIGFLVRPYASQSHLDRLNGAIIANKNARGGGKWRHSASHICSS